MRLAHAARQAARVLGPNSPIDIFLAFLLRL